MSFSCFSLSSGKILKIDTKKNSIIVLKMKEIGSKMQYCV